MEKSSGKADNEISGWPHLTMKPKKCVHSFWLKRNTKRYYCLIAQDCTNSDARYKKVNYFECRHLVIGNWYGYLKYSQKVEECTSGGKISIQEIRNKYFCWTHSIVQLFHLLSQVCNKYTYVNIHPGQLEDLRLRIITRNISEKNALVFVFLNIFV